jgi:hypothetical protein
MAIDVNDDVAADVADALSSSWNTRLGASATLFFFDGTKPAACSDADDGNVILSCTMSSTPFGAASGINFSANPIGIGVCGFAGTVTYWRLKDGSSNVILQGTTGTGTEDIVWDNATFAVSEAGTVTDIDITVQTGG